MAATNASGSATITVSVSDGQSENNLTTQTFTVTVNPLNRPPTLDAIANIALTENSGPQTVNLTGISTGATNETQTLTVTAASSNPALIPNPTVSYTSPNAAGTLAFTPVTNQTGSATITVTVNDGQARNNLTTKSFTVSVREVLDPPTISKIGNQQTAQNEATDWVPFVVGDATIAASNLVVTATSDSQVLIADANIYFDGVGSNRLVMLMPSTNQSGTAIITVQVSNGSTSTNTTFKLAVLPPQVQIQPLMTVTTNGAGSISPSPAAQTWTRGKSYTLTATPGSGQLFAGWSGTVHSSSPKLSFTLSNNMVLQACFVPNPYVPASGSYNGLFYENDEVRLRGAGYFTVSVTTGGKYSGKFQLQGRSYSISGQLDLQCTATNVVKRVAGQTPLTVQIHVGSGSQADQLWGFVTDGVWVSPIFATRSVYSTASPSPLAGQYTIVIPGGDESSPGFGDGFGTVRVSANGALTFAGTLADGTKVSQGTMVSRSGAWPFYAGLYSGNGVAMSWLSFTNRENSDISGPLTWLKQAAAAGRYYANGFTNQCEAIGSVYTAPASTNYVLNFPAGTLEFRGGNLSENFTNSVNFDSGSKIINVSGNSLTMKFSLTAGTFTGQAKQPVTGQTWSFSGAVLQKLNAGYGFTLGTNQSSEVVFAP